jgi:hypothetical protein
MSVIYAFFSKEAECCFLATDDCENTTGRKVDKIQVLKNRWVLSCYGQDIVSAAIGAVSYIEYFRNTVFSTEDIIAQIVRATKRISQKMYPAYLKSYESGNISQSAWEAIQQNSLNVIILDSVNFQLSEANFGSAFPPDRILDTPDIKTAFEADKLHRFVLTERIRNRPFDAISVDDDFFAQAERIVKSDKAENPNIGNLGMVFIKAVGETAVNSVFSDVDDFVNNTYDPEYLIGFNISVEDHPKSKIIPKAESHLQIKDEPNDKMS